MKCRAVLSADSLDAKSIARALDVDNIRLAGLDIKTGCANGKVVTVIESESLSTLINTLDDVICCQMTAEKLLKKQ